MVRVRFSSVDASTDAAKNCYKELDVVAVFVCTHATEMHVHVNCLPQKI